MEGGREEGHFGSKNSRESAKGFIFTECSRFEKGKGHWMGWDEMRFLQKRIEKMKGEKWPKGEK
jgi:hypothetical protein